MKKLLFMLLLVSSGAVNANIFICIQADGEIAKYGAFFSDKAYNAIAEQIDDIPTCEKLNEIVEKVEAKEGSK